MNIYRLMYRYNTNNQIIVLLLLKIAEAPMGKENDRMYNKMPDISLSLAHSRGGRPFQEEGLQLQQRHDI